MTRPDFVIIGAPKCGTTAMKSNFSKYHPGIWLGGRENNFFNMNWEKGLSWYESKFPTKTNANVIYGEKTPSYIYSLEQPGVVDARQHCHKRMHQLLPDAKLILCLRNPADRAYSHWYMEQSTKRHYKLSFDEALEADIENMADPNYIRFSSDDFLQKGFYIDYIDNLLRYYDKNQVLICVTEELKTDIENQYNRIYDFLGLPVPEGVTYSVSATNYEQPFTDTQRDRMADIFTPYNRRLFEFLGREIASWK